ncbi:phosphotransferase [Demequina iriomotensis]|uniref:phosphotransferase n=1 Tax=Demequina iriomotensis TaxID=1536641 RepID=UPI0007817C74|nr:phosphotransferase [Demequina iriomotensis]
MLPSARIARPVTVDDAQVRALVDDQFPHLADQEVGRRYTHEDHIAVRIGDRYGALFPRFALDDPLFARATDVLAPHLGRYSFPLSAPIATGLPGHGFPYHWTLVEWVSASTAAFVPLHASSARALGTALREIHVAAPEDAPQNPATAPGLGALLAEWDRLLVFASLRGAPENRVLDVESVDSLFRVGAVAPVDVPITWTHGRLEPRSIQSDRGQFAGLLIWHRFGTGDPAADLGGAATVIPLDMRDEFYAGYGEVSTATAWRAQSYQLFSALHHIEIDDPFLARMAWERLIELGLAHEA